MPPSVSPERPVKRSRTLLGEAAAEGPRHAASGGGDYDRLPDLSQPESTGPRQPLIQKQQQQQQQTPQQQQLQQPAKSPQPPGPQPQSQLQSDSEPRAQLQSQSQPQPPAQAQQQQAQAQQQQAQQQQAQAQAGGLLPSGAVSVLPTALPQWAEEVLRGVDPFWQPKETLAVVTTQQAGPAPGTHGQLQSASALFTVSPSALAAIADKKAQARLVCVQPTDRAPRRCHWYGGSYVLLNGRSYEVTKEDRVQLMLGSNQADQAVDLSTGLVRGANRLTLLWPVGVAGAVAALRLCEPRSAEELRRTHLAPPLPLSRAVALVRAHVAGETEDGGDAGADAGRRDQERSSQEGAAAAGGALAAVGGAGTAAAEEADGAALGSGPVTVSLRCPLHGGLAAAPAHFGATAAAAPLAFFDLEAFLELAAGSGGWVCPASGRLGDLGDLRPHAFLTAVIRTLDHNGVRSRVEAIEVTPCGRWRPKDSRVPLLSALDADPTDPASRPPPSFDPRLLDPEDDGGAAGRDVVDLTDD